MTVQVQEMLIDRNYRYSRIKYRQDHSKHIVTLQKMEKQDQEAYRKKMQNLLVCARFVSAIHTFHFSLNVSLEVNTCIIFDVSSIGYCQGLCYPLNQPFLQSCIIIFMPRHYLCKRGKC